MSLDIELGEQGFCVRAAFNITHNLTGMADAAGLYGVLWRPEENNILCAGDLIKPLKDGIAVLEADPAKYEAMNPENGWGSYRGFLFTLGELLTMCEQQPTLEIRACR